MDNQKQQQIFTVRFFQIRKLFQPILGNLMNDPDKAPKVMYAFMQMKKFNIEKLMNV